MKYTLLSTKGSELLENLIIKYGQIITTADIFATARLFLTRKQTEYFITTLTKQGWLMRIKKGLYVISDLSTKGFLSLSPHKVANLLVDDSYVSFESALQYYGMFDQLTNRIISVSLKIHKTVRLQSTEYVFVKTKTYHFGWREVTIDNQTVRVATAEKALIDMINFHRSTYSIDAVVEKLREYENDLDFVRMNDYLSKMSMTTIKIFGFIFDLLNIDSSRLWEQARNAKGAHRMTSDAKCFDAKWRLYYNSYFSK